MACTWSDLLAGVYPVGLHMVRPSSWCMAGRVMKQRQTIGRCTCEGDEGAADKAVNVMFVLAVFSAFIRRCIVPGVRVLGSIFRVYA